jgi:hypothetical protein
MSCIGICIPGSPAPRKKSATTLQPQAASVPMLIGPLLGFVSQPAK